ncbi:MAG: hypothetical protein KME45_09000 [Stenomitos rutilans HA7619-LM2]|jgi:hypothetical protein|nr:hypothetical protein [Stenomitos rutilans HA7619-LM2]
MDDKPKPTPYIELIQTQRATELQLLSLLYIHYAKRVVERSLAVRLVSLRSSSEPELSRSSLFVPSATQEHKQGVLNATVVLVLYGND